MVFLSNHICHNVSDYNMYLYIILLLYVHMYAYSGLSTYQVYTQYLISFVIDCYIFIGTMMTYELDSSDSLRVGRYSVLIREVETGGEGYGRFGIYSCEYVLAMIIQCTAAEICCGHVRASVL